MYDDMLDIEYPFDLNHKRMSEYDRCSQFMPFSALTGYKEAVIETARLTSDKVLLDNDLKEIISDKINLINNNLYLKPIVKITFFIPDKSKSGGSYKNVRGIVKKIDLYNNIIVIDNIIISFNNIINVESDLFDIIE